MKEEAKNGKYEKFDISKASWVCPHCKKDSLKLKQIEDKYLYFDCDLCGLSSKDYAIAMSPKSTFNSVYREFKKQWPWINYLTKKFYALGAQAARRIIEEAK